MNQMMNANLAMNASQRSGIQMPQPPMGTPGFAGGNGGVAR